MDRVNLKRAQLVAAGGTPLSRIMSAIIMGLRFFGVLWLATQLEH